MAELTDAALMRKAARLLRREAKALREASTLWHNGRRTWEPSELGRSEKADYDTMIAVVRELEKRAWLMT